MLVRNPKLAYLKDWAYVLGAVKGEAALGWPAKQEKVSGVECFFPSTKGVVAELWLPVFDTDQWEVQPVKRRPPSYAILAAA